MMWACLAKQQSPALQLPALGKMHWDAMCRPLNTMTTGLGLVQQEKPSQGQDLD